MADEDQNENTNTNDNPSEANAPAPVDETKSTSKSSTKGTGDVTPGGEQRVDSKAKAHVLGEGADKDFDAVGHGKQTALENHVKDQPVR